MSRSALFRTLTQIAQWAHYAQAHELSAAQTLEQYHTIEPSNLDPTARSHRPDTGLPSNITASSIERSDVIGLTGPKIAIVGAGLAGLTCAQTLKKSGVRAIIYEATDRAGGRCWSLCDDDRFPGQVIERGGELIDSQHTVLLGYAAQLGLEIEDLAAQPGEARFFFQGQLCSEAQLLAEYQDLLVTIAPDLARLSRQPTAQCHTPVDRYFDEISVTDYLASACAGDAITAYIRASYLSEYGLEPEAQTALHFLLVNLDKDIQASPLDVCSDERYHIVGGNEQIVRHLYDQLTDQIELEMRLIRVRRRSNLQLELTFDRSGQTHVVVCDAAVITIPFSVLRQVDLDESLELPDWKRAAIAQLDNGTQSKLMVGFTGRPWQQHGSNGASFSDLNCHQITWEGNPSKASRDRGVIVSLVSGNLGAQMSQSLLMSEVDDFVRDFDRIYPGVGAQVRYNRQGKVAAHLENWTTHPFTLGSYVCYRPGQLTRFAGLEGEPVGNLFFAGEHTNSFYEWQGFLEGAARSGIHAAQALLERITYPTLKQGQKNTHNNLDLAL